MQSNIDINQAITVGTKLVTLKPGLYVLRYVTIESASLDMTDTQVPLVISQAPIELTGTMEFMCRNHKKPILSKPGDYLVVNVFDGEAVLSVSKYLPKRMENQVHVRWKLEPLDADKKNASPRKKPQIQFNKTTKNAVEANSLNHIESTNVNNSYSDKLAKLNIPSFTSTQQSADQKSADQIESVNQPEQADPFATPIFENKKAQIAQSESSEPRPVPMTITGHIQNIGDLTVNAGEWLMHPQGGARLEAIKFNWINQPKGLDIRVHCKSEGKVFQSRTGEFIGQLRQAAKMSEFAVILDGESADEYDVKGEVAFSDGQVIKLSQNKLIKTSSEACLVGICFALFKKEQGLVQTKENAYSVWTDSSKTHVKTAGI